MAAHLYVKLWQRPSKQHTWTRLQPGSLGRHAGEQGKQLTREMGSVGRDQTLEEACPTCTNATALVFSEVVPWETGK